MEFSVRHTAKRAIRRLTLIGWLALSGLFALPIQAATAATPPERILPENTIFLFKLPDVKAFRESFRSSQYGQLWNDSALKEFREELALKLEDATKSLKEKIGVSVKELFELPQGSLAIAAILRDDPNLPVAAAILAEAGENEQKMLEIFGRTTKQAEDAGAKVATEQFNGLSVHVVRFPEREPEKDKDQKDKKPIPQPPLVWTNSGGLFFITSDVDVIKDLATHREGRDKSLASTDAFGKTQAKTDSSKAQAIWYLDVNKLVRVVIKANAKGGDAEAQQQEVLVKELGIGGLRSVGGCFTLGTGNFDSLSKTFFNAPRPVEGLLKVFSFPPMPLRPESWVPATVAT